MSESTLIQSTSANEAFDVTYAYTTYAPDSGFVNEAPPPVVTQVLQFERGFGVDTLKVGASGYRSSGMTVHQGAQPYIIKLPSGVSPSDVEFSPPSMVRDYSLGSRFEQGSILTWSLSIKGTTDRLVVQDFVALGEVQGEGPTALVQIEFGDGTVWNGPQVQMALNPSANPTGLYLTGTAGDDIIASGAGADVLVFGSGSGVDRYVSFENAQQDIIELTGNLGLDDFIVNTQALAWPTSLSLVLKDGSAALLMTDQASDGSGRITPISNLPSVKLADGTIVTADQLYARRQQSTDGADTLYADPFAVVNGGNGNDRLIAGAVGGFVLQGGEGNDTLVAGTAYGELAGGAGADTFLVERTSGVRRGSQIFRADGADTIEYASGITRADVLGGFVASGNSVALSLSILGDQGGLEIQNIADAAGVVVKFADGTLLKAVDLAPVTGVDLYGQWGDETLKGFTGDDTLTGSGGNDLMDGGAGADTFIYRLGDGNDTIVADGKDIIQFQTVGAANLKVGKVGASMTNAVVLGSSTDGNDGTITLANAGQWAGLQVRLGDGTVVTGEQIMALATKPDDLMLNGTSQADKLTGLAGNDTLSGLAGRDTLAGGLGNDLLIGGKGGDTYLFNRGDGQDHITENDTTWFTSDLLKVGGATSKQLWFTKSGNSLDISVIGTQDKVTIDGWFLGSANKVEKITASDGKSLSAAKVQTLVNAMASFTPPADGVTTLPANTPTSVTKLIASSWS